MALQLLNTFPRFYGEDSLSVPASSYLPDTIELGNFITILSNVSMYKCIDNSDQSNLSWEKIPELADLPLPAVYLSPAFSAVTTATQLSTTRNSYVNYVFPTSMTSLLTSQALTATLQYADDSGFTTNVVTVNVDVQGCSGIVSLTLAGRLQVNGRIPIGKYRKVTLSQTGGATVPTTISSSQEVLL